jgi:hypothetical protein
VTPGPGQTLEECIRDDVHDIVARTGRTPRLAYLVNPVDVAAMLARLPFIGGAVVRLGETEQFEMHTDVGYVTVIADRSHPRGCTHRFVVCACGALALYVTGVEKCTACAIAGGSAPARPYAPGEKMTDRHPDSVIAQVVEETIAKHPGLAKLQKRTGYQPLAPQPEPAFRLFNQDGSLYVDTKHGPIKVTADPSVETPRIITTCPGYNGMFHIPVRFDNEVMAAVEGDVGCFDPPARPDGFDQRQVDAARAALLAPVPPRYPRNR